MKRNGWITSVALAALLFAPVMSMADVNRGTPADKLEKNVRHQLNMLPFFSVFDYVTFSLDGTKVILTGEVSRPSLKLDAQRAVKAVEGVSAVENRIEVLPTSFFDDQIRRGELRAIYGNSVLSRYGLSPYGPIRIIVQNGKVTLKGYVSSQMDKNIAGLQAGTVFGVFSVTNDLKVEKS
jgi:hyperosmotically inducible protein